MYFHKKKQGQSRSKQKFKQCYNRSTRVEVNTLRLKTVKNG